jgi:hypothetical protein
MVEHLARKSARGTEGVTFKLPALLHAAQAAPNKHAATAVPPDHLLVVQLEAMLPALSSPFPLARREQT